MHPPGSRLEHYLKVARTLHLLERAAQGEPVRLGNDAGMDQKDKRTAYLLLRAVAGESVDAWHKPMACRAGNVCRKADRAVREDAVAVVGVRAFGFMLPEVEALLGLLLLIGFETRDALVGSSLLILVLTFGSSLAQDWNRAGIQLVYAAVFCALTV